MNIIAPRTLSELSYCGTPSSASKTAPLWIFSSAPSPIRCNKKVEGNAYSSTDGQSLPKFLSSLCQHVFHPIVSKVTYKGLTIFSAWGTNRLQRRQQPECDVLWSLAWSCVSLRVQYRDSTITVTTKSDKMNFRINTKGTWILKWSVLHSVRIYAKF